MTIAHLLRRRPRPGTPPGEATPRDWCVATVIPLIGVRVEERGLTRDKAQRRAGAYSRAMPMPLEWAESTDRQIAGRYASDWTGEEFSPEEVRRAESLQRIAAREMGVDLAGQETWRPDPTLTPLPPKDTP